MTQRLVADGALRDEPFTLVDVGCALGIFRRFRVFGEQLRAVGIDPQIEECRRLAAAEEEPAVTYRAALVGLPPDHPFSVGRATLDGLRERYYTGFPRASTRRALAILTSDQSPTAKTQTWSQQRLATDRLTLRDVAELEGLASCDFIKTDTDGSDLEAVLACEDSLRDLSVLGLQVEMPFIGSDAPEANTFHNIDRVLRRNGFSLFSLTTVRYSRTALPAQFVRAEPSGTVTGQVIWGDGVYLRDASSPEYGSVWPEALPPLKLLKLACIEELFELPDCAAELLLTHRERLQELVDVDSLLDLLTPRGPDGRHVPYAEHVARFEEDPRSFYPT